MIRTLAALALIVAPTVAVVAQDGATTTPQRIKNLTLKKGEVCPRSSAEEVVVCSTLDEPYRIPKELRDQPKETPANTAWSVRADRVMEDQQKVLPGSCSAIGTYGQSGCAQKAAEDWAADKRAKANPATPK